MRNHIAKNKRMSIDSKIFRQMIREYGYEQALKMMEEKPRKPKKKFKPRLDNGR